MIKNLIGIQNHLRVYCSIPFPTGYGGPLPILAHVVDANFSFSDSNLSVH